MTEEELRGLTTEEFNILSDRVSSEAARRNAIDSLRNRVNASVQEYKGWGGSPSDLLDLFEDSKAESATDTVTQAEPETTPVVDVVPDSTEDQNNGRIW